MVASRGLVQGNDMQRLGLFSEMGYVTIKEPYTSASNRKYPHTLEASSSPLISFCCIYLAVTLRWCDLWLSFSNLLIPTTCRSCWFPRKWRVFSSKNLHILTSTAPKFQPPISAPNSKRALLLIRNPPQGLLMSPWALLLIRNPPQGLLMSPRLKVNRCWQPPLRVKPGSVMGTFTASLDESLR